MSSSSELDIPAAVLPRDADRTLRDDPSDAAMNLLRKIMPLTGLALWEAWSERLELIRFDAGETTRPVFTLDSEQLRPGACWTENVYPPDRAKIRSLVSMPAPQTPDGRSIDYRLIVGDGELLWVRHWMLSTTSPANGRRRLTGLLMAIPEQKHLEWECLRVSERECNRIGQDLHDDLCQVLAGLTFMIRVVGQRAATADTSLRQSIEELATELEGATDRVRAMAHGLFPAQLNYATLRQALNAFARQTETRFPVRFIVRLARGFPRHTPEQIIHVFRIVQESVSNAVRHGGATTIEVDGIARDGRVQITVTDNGRGFPATSVRPEGIGMHVMEYRARTLGGKLVWRNGKSSGAVIEFSYPVGGRESGSAQSIS